MMIFVLIGLGEGPLTSRLKVGRGVRVQGGDFSGEKRTGQQQQVGAVQVQCSTYECDTYNRLYTVDVRYSG